MIKRAATRKRPCKICRKWFTPNPRVGFRQKTCGAKECQREWHRRKCAEWNRNNPAYFKGNYLREKLEAQSSPKAETTDAIHSEDIPMDLGLKSGIDFYDFQEVFTFEQAIFMEYLIG